MISSNINNYTMTEALEALRAGVKTYLMKDPETGEYTTEEFFQNPFYLEGAPGIGKTKGVQQVAEELGIGFVSFSLTHHTRNSLLGLPAISDREEGELGGKYTKYTMSEIIARIYDEVNAGHEEGILLLDEFPCMSPTIMPAMLAFLQTKNIGDHKLPKGWVIVLCGNPPEYNKHSQVFDSAVMDRLRTLHIVWDSASFIQYAKKKDFHPEVLNYLELNPDSVYRLDDSSLVTCRGWENLSDQLQKYELLEEPVDYRMVRQFIKSDAIATSFFNYYIESININKSDIRSILEGRAGAELVEKYSMSNASVRLNLLQILQKDLIEEVSIPYKKSVSFEQLRSLFSKVKDKGLITGNFPNMGYLTPMDVLNHLINNNGDTTGLFAPNPNTPVFSPRPLQLELPEVWGDRESVNELRELLTEMCSEEEMCGRGFSTPNDLDGEVEKQADNLNRFLRMKSSDLKKSWNAVAKHIDHVFCFLEKMEGGETYSERLYYFICHNPALLRTVTEGNSKEYNRRLSAIYGGNYA